MLLEIVIPITDMACSFTALPVSQGAELRMGRMSCTLLTPHSALQIGVFVIGLYCSTHRCVRKSAFVVFGSLNNGFIISMLHEPYCIRYEGSFCDWIYLIEVVKACMY